MRLAYAALVFSLLVLQKDPQREPPLRYTPQPGGLRWEQGMLQRLRRTFSWEPGLCWVSESPWGSYLAGMAAVLLWALLERWAASCLTRLQTPMPTSAAHLETETAEEMDSERPRRKCSLCVLGQPSTSSFQSYDQPSEMRRRSRVTFGDMGKRSWEEVLYSEYKRSRSSSSSSKRSLPDHSSSPSSSSCSSSSCFCLTRLNSLDFCCSSGDPTPAKTSLDTTTPWTCGSESPYSGSESDYADSRSTPLDPGLPKKEDLCLARERRPLQGKEKPSLRGTLFLLEEHSETESVSLFLQPKEVHTQTSFARINIVQSSAYKKDDQVFLVEKSLQVQMGAARLPRARPSLPKPIFANDVRKPPGLPVLALASLQRADKTRKCNHIASLCGLLGTFEETIPEGSSQRGERPGLNAIFARASCLEDFGSDPSVVEKVDKDTRDFLEFHVKKKMVQWKCGMPSVVAKSVEAYWLLPSLPQDKHSRMPTETVSMTLTVGVGPALHHSPHAAVGPKPPKGAPGPKGGSILSSWVLEDIDRLAFHAAVKMLEIKMGAFPDKVENSFQLFGGLSEKIFLPKMIHSGNKIPKAKHPSLPFLAQENLCILDLNVKRKCLAFRGSFSAVYTKLAAAMTARYSQLSESEGEPTERVARLLVSVWRQIHTVDIAYLGLEQPVPAPQALDPSPAAASLPLRAEESLEGPFQDGPLRKLAACPVPEDTSRTLEEQLLVEGHGKCQQEKVLKRGPSQQAPPPSFDHLDPKVTLSRKAMKFRAEASIIRTSIFLELELKKEKLNVHLKKKMQAKLRPPQGAALELTIEPGKKAKTSGVPRQARSSAQTPGRARRSFCYVCMPSGETGTQLKTVCWSLPKWILEMNGYRTPEVARFASKSKSPQLVQK